MDNTPIISPQDPARMWNILCHASALLGLAIPFAFLLGPLVVWLLKKNEFPSVDKHGKEALNFQLSFLIYMIVATILIAIFIGPFLMLLVGAVDVILVIIASVKVANGESFSYPFTIRFLK